MFCLYIEIYYWMYLEFILVFENIFDYVVLIEIGVIFFKEVQFDSSGQFFVVV